MSKCRICGKYTLGNAYCKKCWNREKQYNPEWINRDGEGTRSRKTGY